MKKHMHDETTHNSTDVDPQISENPQAAEPEVKKPSTKQPFMFVILALAVIPLVLAVLNYQTIIGMAASIRCQPIQRVAINPGVITTTTKSLPIEMSTMAYDMNGKPITKGISYQWGISSNNSIGTVKARRDLGTFYPKNAGSGDLYVQAKNACTKVKTIGSIKVVVQSAVTAVPTKNPPRRK